MKLIILIRKNGKIKIEVPDDANIEEVLIEHEIKSYQSLTVEEIKIKK